MAKVVALFCILQCVQQLHGRRVKYNSKSEALALIEAAKTKAKEGKGSDLAVTCTFNAIIVEDMHPGDAGAQDDGFEWAECTDDAGVVHYLADNDATESIEQGSRVHLVLEDAPAPEVKGLTLPWLNEHKPFYEAVSVEIIDGSFIESNAVVTHTTQETKVMKVVSIVCNYNDHKVTYINEQGIMDALYLTEAEFAASKKSGSYPGSLSDMIAKSSYGKVSLPRSEGKVVTIEMGSNWADITGCPVNDIATTAKAKAIEQYPDVDFDSFHFFEYFIPNQPNGGCTWGGLASVGCGHYSVIGEGKCNAWYRSGQPFVRAHELGHNLGFLHAGGDQNGNFVEYGDPEASMGASYRFSSFIASARYQSDFLEDEIGQVVTWEGQSGAQWKLQSLSLPLGQEGASAVAIKFECATCVPRVSAHKHVTGGNLWVQFRGDEGYSALHLHDQYENKVYVHLARKYSNKRYGKGSEMWAKLDVGEHYETPDNRFVHVCSIEGDLAKVAVGTSLAEAQEQCSSDVIHTPAPTTPAPTLPPVTADCNDNHNSCEYFVKEGYCAKDNQYHSFMMRSCKRSCNACASSQTPQPTAQATPRPTTPAPTTPAPTTPQPTTPETPRPTTPAPTTPAPTTPQPTTPETPRPTTPTPTTPAPTTPQPTIPEPTQSPTPPPTNPPETGDDCADKKPTRHCERWTDLGYCNEGNTPNYRPFMLNNCKKSCGACTSSETTPQPTTPAPTTPPPTAQPTAQPTEDESTRRLKDILASVDGELANDVDLVEQLIAWKEGMNTKSSHASDAENCPHNKQVPATCWADSAYQKCPIDRQGAYDAVMDQKGDPREMHAVYLKLITDKAGCTEEKEAS